jgi:hypothetical protein
MKKIILISILASYFLTGCQKDYTCECGNPGGVTATYKIHDTKKRAETKCSSYCTQCNAILENYCLIK